MKALLEVENLSAKFLTDRGIVSVLDSIHFKLYEKEILGIVGESGCGKTVTCQAILKVNPLSFRAEGKILFANKDIMSLSERQMRKIRGKHISMIFQNPSSLNPLYKVGYQIEEVLKLHGTKPKNAKDNVLALLERTRLPNPLRIFEAYPHQLSGGMKQRVCTCIAIACDPEIMIADEPTTALDVTIQMQVLRWFEELLREGIINSMIFISHNLGVVNRLCHRIVVMYAGQVVEIVKRDNILHARHPYTKRLLDAVPEAKEIGSQLRGIEGDVPNLLFAPTGCRFHNRCYASQRECKSQRPELKEIGKGEYVACHLM